MPSRLGKHVFVVYYPQIFYSRHEADFPTFGLVGFKRVGLSPSFPRLSRLVYRRPSVRRSGDRWDSRRALGPCGLWYIGTRRMHLQLALFPFL